MESGPIPPQSEPGLPRRALSYWIPGCLVLALVLGLTLARRQRQEREERGLSWVDPACARVERVPDWVDPRWLERVRAVLRRHPPFAVAQEGFLEPLRSDLEALSFVRRVERCEASAEGGLALELVLRAPVACIPAGGEFALVGEDGVVLEGRWPLPPRLGCAFLPVIGPLGDRLLARARSGDWLAEPEHRDALDVVLSLGEHLNQAERAALGHVLVDARSSRRASVDEPGVRLELEGERLALFGRAPSAGQPGELGAAEKWRSLLRALELYESDPVANDWELVDLRWDRPDLGLRAPTVVASAPELSPRASPGGTDGRRSRGDSRPQVR